MPIVAWPSPRSPADPSYGSLSSSSSSMSPLEMSHMQTGYYRRVAEKLDSFRGRGRSALLALTCMAGRWGDRPLQPPQPGAHLHTCMLTSLCHSPRKFKSGVKFIVSISFILSIVLHFIICCDILNGACHSILTTARGYSHLLCQAFRQP